MTRLSMVLIIVLCVGSTAFAGKWRRFHRHRTQWRPFHRPVVTHPVKVEKAVPQVRRVQVIRPLRQWLPGRGGVCGT